MFTGASKKKTNGKWTDSWLPVTLPLNLRIFFFAVWFVGHQSPFLLSKPILALLAQRPIACEWLTLASPEVTMTTLLRVVINRSDEVSIKIMSLCPFSRCKAKYEPFKHSSASSASEKCEPNFELVQEFMPVFRLECGI